MAPEPIVLKEYEEASIVLSPAQQRALRTLAGGNVTVLPGDDDVTWKIKATSFVGTVVTPAVRLLVQPKVSTANLFHLLEGGGRALPLGPEVFDYDTTGDLVAAFATFFARHLEACLGRGIEHRYEPVEERLTAVKGRIDLPAQTRLAGLPLPAVCRFDDYTADTSLNRLVRSAALRLSRFPGVTLTTRRALLQLLARLEGVGTIRTQDIRTPTLFTRLNEHYRLTERLARLVHAGSSLLDATGSTGAAVFFVDMNKVFEEFVEARLRHYLRGRLTVNGQVPMKLDHAGEVGMRPDLVFVLPGIGPSYVADSKYKITDDGFGREGDYYQLLAYVTAMQLPEGALIYCRHDGAPPARAVTVGPDAKRLTTRALRLDGTITDVEEGLRSLADDIDKFVR